MMVVEMQIGPNELLNGDPSMYFWANEAIQKTHVFYVLFFRAEFACEVMLTSTE